QRSLRLVEQEKTFLEPALHDSEKCLTMRAAVQRLSAIQRVGISTELRVRRARVEQGSEMGLELGSQEVPVARTPAERRPEDVRKRASLLGRVSGAEVRPRAAGNGQSREGRYGLQQRRLSAAILADEDRDR